MKCPFGHPFVVSLVAIRTPAVTELDLASRRRQSQTRVPPSRFRFVPFAFQFQFSFLSFSGSLLLSSLFPSPSSPSSHRRRLPSHPRPPCRHSHRNIYPS